MTRTESIELLFKMANHPLVRLASTQKRSFKLNYIILGLVSLLIVGCCRSEKSTPIAKIKTSPLPDSKAEESMASSNVTSVEGGTPLIDQVLAKTRVSKKKDHSRVSNYSTTFPLKTEIFKTFNQGQYIPQITKQLTDYWEKASMEQKDEILAFLANNSVLSRKAWGLKPWSIGSFLMSLKTNPEEDLLILKHLISKSGSVQPDYRFYLSSKYNKNLGGNTILWKELILKTKSQ